MSRDRTIVPTNLLDWPRVTNLLPEIKFILQTLWMFKDLSCAGAGFIAIGPFASTLSLKPESVWTGLKMLADAQLIILDEATSEIFILDWFRFHEFKNPVAQRMLSAAAGKIQSLAIKEVILEKSKGCLPTPTPTSTSTSTSTSTPPPPPGGNGGGLIAGKIKPVFSQEDLAEFAESAAWNLRARGELVGPGFRPYIHRRIEETGPNQTDLEQLQAFRDFTVAADAKVYAEATAAILAEANRHEKARAEAERKVALDRFFSLSADQQESTRQQFLRHLNENAAVSKDHKVLVHLLHKHGPTANPQVKSAFQNWLVSASPPPPMQWVDHTRSGS